MVAPPMSSNSCVISNAKVLVNANSVLSALACVASLLTVIAIVLLKVYRKFLYRLTLYVAVTSFCYVLTLGISVLPLNISDSSVTIKNGWDGTCAFIGGAHQYFYFSNTVAIVWICMYTTRMGFKKQTAEYQPLEEEVSVPLYVRLLSHKGEVIGCITLALLPAAMFWYPYLERAYGMTGIWCWMVPGNSTASGSTLLAYRVLSRLPTIIATLLCVCLLLCLQLRLCYVGTHVAYWRPIKTVALVLAYPILFAIPSIGSMVHAILPTTTSDCVVLNNLEMFFLSLFYFSAISLPVLFLLQWDVRLTITRRYGDLQTDPSTVSVSREVSMASAQYQ